MLPPLVLTWEQPIFLIISYAAQIMIGPVFVMLPQVFKAND